MLKSTEIKLNILQRQNDLKEKEFGIQRDQLEQQKREFAFEQETKDRVDVSLKEYTRLQDCEKELNMYKEIVEKLLKPFFAANIDKKVIKDIYDNRVEKSWVEVIDCVGAEDPLCYDIIHKVRIRGAKLK